MTLVITPPSPQYSVRVGDVDLQSPFDDSRSWTSPVARFARHPGFRRPVAYFDVAVLHLRDALPSFAGFVVPVCLPSLPVGQSSCMQHDSA